MMGLPPLLSGSSPSSAPHHPKFRRLWSPGASQGLQEHLTTTEPQQAGGKEDERRNGREEYNRECGRECGLLETPKAGGEGGEKAGSFPEGRNHVQKATEPLTQLSQKMEMVLFVFKTLTAGP